MEKMVNYKFVHEHQSEIVMDLDFYQFAELIDVKPDPGSHFIHSMSEPYIEEDIEDMVMHNWLDHFKIKFHQLHASGHLNRRWQAIYFTAKNEIREGLPKYVDVDIIELERLP